MRRWEGVVLGETAVAGGGGVEWGGEEWGWGAGRGFTLQGEGRSRRLGGAV